MYTVHYPASLWLKARNENTTGRRYRLHRGTKGDTGLFLVWLFDSVFFDPVGLAGAFEQKITVSPFAL